MRTSTPPGVADLASPPPIALERPASPAHVTIRTRAGLLRGTVGDGIHIFKGIPYAEPPFGRDHLRPPRPSRAWTGVRDALDWGPEPPQPRLPAGMSEAQDLAYDPATPGEDCLNLNVWTPSPGASRLPVLVWIPGGMFEVGSGASYDGSRFARDGIVCVTLDYRVGPEGFLVLDDGVPNRGLLDQIAALEWVRDQIDAFGGDPDNVTIAGESAGAMSVGTLLSMPRAAGLFRRAIVQSGGAHRVIDLGTARLVARELCARLETEPTTDAVAAIPWPRLLEASLALKSDLATDPDPDRWGLDVVASSLPWQPVVDGEVVPDRPIARIEAGASRDVDLIVGSNVDDWRMFRVLSGDLDRVTEEVLGGPVARYGYLSAGAYGLPAEAGLADYRKRYPSATPGELLAAIQTDWWCRIPAMRLADAHARLSGGGTYMYEFAWPSPAFGGQLGACHALEIPFVFDTLDLGPRQMVGGLLGDEPPQSVATDMHRAWIRFARTGDPGWPAYDLTYHATMRFATRPYVIDDPRAAERAIWTGVL
jgi:para-nitrobenzyl esterase